MTTVHRARRLGPAPAPGGLSAAERLSRDELQARQLDRLQRTLRHAYARVPFYRQAFDAAGVHLSDCREPADLAKFPTMTKHDLRGTYPFGPASGRVLPDGQTGELVFTSLTKEAMPVIRYRTRDLSALRPGTARPAFRRMDKVTRRSDDMIIMRGVNVFPTRIEEIVLVTEGVAPHFQLKLTKSDRVDHMTVLAQARQGTPADRRDTAAAEIASRVKDGVGISVAVEVCDPDTLERSVGKIRRVIDQRAP